MKLLPDIDLKYRYRSGRDDIVEDFFTPCLEVATLYQRAVGFFSASSLVSLSRGIKKLLNNKGRMQLIASPVLSEADINAIKKGYSLRDRVEKVCLEQVINIESIDKKNNIEALAWLIYTKRLDIKIAIRIKLNERYGMYHEKLGVIHDATGNYVTFSGSINESETALIHNFESFDVDVSWNDIKGIAREKKIEFLELWENKTEGLDIIDFPKAATEQLLKCRKYNSIEDYLCSSINYSSNDAKEHNVSEKFSTVLNPQIPDYIKLRDYQKDAIKNWFSGACTGIFKMATGSGKTITALAGITKLCECYRNNNKSLLTIIVVPYQHLVQQWAEELEKFIIHPVLCFRSSKSWISNAQSLVLLSNTVVKNDGVFLVTDATFRGSPFQGLLHSISCDLVFVVDECHNAGAPNFRAVLPDKARYRLGLSATPERHHDTEGTDALLDYFGSISIEYGLKEALDSNALCQYKYYPHLIDLTPDEAHEYIDLSRRIGMELSNNDDINENEDLQRLLIKRARVCANAKNKLKHLFKLLEKYTNDSHILIYCGDGRMDNTDNLAEDCRQVEYITQVIGGELGMRCHKFTAGESVIERKTLVQRFSSGDLQALVAIRCLDEGFDVPATEIAFILASSTNPRQFVQRRGRVLRQSPETGKKLAIINDFIIIPPMPDDDSVTFSGNYSLERNLFKKELTRISEFARLAKNGSEAMQSLAKLREHYGLTHI